MRSVRGVKPADQLDEVGVVERAAQVARAPLDLDRSVAYRLPGKRHDHRLEGVEGARAEVRERLLDLRGLHSAGLEQARRLALRGWAADPAGDDREHECLGACRQEGRLPRAVQDASQSARGG